MKKLIDIIEALDGAGLVITDMDAVLDALTNMNLDAHEPIVPESREIDTSDEHLRAIAEQRNLAMWWFDEDYVQNNLLDAATPEAITQIVKDLAGDAGVQERIAEEVVEYINNHNIEYIKRS